MNIISGIIVDTAIKLHSVLGPGLLESAYHACLRQDLLERGLNVRSEIDVPLNYNNVTIDIGYRLDLLVEETVIVELKAVNELLPIHKAQLLTYLKLSKKPLGLLLNFNSVRLKSGIIRVINSPSANSSASPAPLRFNSSF